MPRLIIGIHGLANKPQKDTLADWWRRSIVEGLKVNCRITNPKFNFEIVYFSDLLYKSALHQDRNFPFDDLYNYEPYRGAPKGGLKTYNKSWVELARAGTQSILGGAVDVVLQRVLRDLDFYYDPNSKIADRNGQVNVARKVLEEEMERVLVTNKSGTIMLVAHSIGSIIAYDVLRNLGRTRKDVEVSHFVTIGSPLGLPYVKGKILEERTYDRGEEAHRVRTPSIVTRAWTNYVDSRDPVASGSHLSDDYRPNTKYVRVADDLILNDYEVKGKRNSHKSYGYLRAPEVSDHIRKFLGV